MGGIFSGEMNLTSNRENILGKVGGYFGAEVVLGMAVIKGEIGIIDRYAFFEHR